MNVHIPAQVTEQGSIPHACPLCAADQVAEFTHDQQRIYLQCGVCRLVFVPPSYFLTPEAEMACYDLHQNDPTDTRYRQFLSRLCDPLMEKLAPGACGLDFGSGPGPTLSVMLTEAGFRMAIYDPFYAPHADVLEQPHTYDFVTASEVVEHLHDPRTTLDRVWAALKPGGWLAIMTKRVRDAEAFSRWHYKQDPTHVIFFSEATFAWLAAHWQAELEIAGPDVVFFRKLAVPQT